MSGVRCLAVGALLCILGCGSDGPASPGSGSDFPVVETHCADGPTAVYMIMGLSGRVADATSPQLEARIAMGDTIRLRIELSGCGPVPYESSWVSTNPSVARVSPDPQYGSFVAELRALAEGETSVYADAKLRDLPDLRVHLAYCGGSDFVGCRTPRRIARVVVAR